MTWKEILKGLSGIEEVADIFTRMGLEDVTQENLLPWTGKDRYFKPKGSKESDEFYFKHLDLLRIEPVINSENVKIIMPDIGRRPPSRFVIDSEQEAEGVAKEYLELHEIAVEQTR